MDIQDLVVSQAYLRTHGGEPLAHDPSTLRQEDPLIAAGSSGSEASAQSGQAGREVGATRYGKTYPSKLTLK